MAPHTAHSALHTQVRTIQFWTVHIFYVWPHATCKSIIMTHSQRTAYSTGTRVRTVMSNEKRKFEFVSLFVVFFITIVRYVYRTRTVRMI